MRVFNAAHKRCEEKGEKDCEARSFKQANSVVGKMKDE
jgi:hypothetical protein